MEEVFRREYAGFSIELEKRYRRFLSLYLLTSFLKSALMGTSILIWTEIFLLFLRLQFTNFLRIIYISIFTLLAFSLHLRRIREKISSLSGSGEELRNALEVAEAQRSWESLELKLLFFKRVLSLLRPSKEYIKKTIGPPLIYLQFLLGFCVYLSSSFIKIEKKSSYSPEIFREAVLKIKPPSYTKLKGYEIESSSGRFKILKGSNVEIKADLIKTGGTPSFKLCDEKIPFKKMDDKFQVQFLMERECEFEVQIENRFSVRHYSPFYFELQRDEYPEVEIRFPIDDVVMKTGERDIGISFFANDDFGLSSVDLVYLFSGMEFRMKYEKPLEDLKSVEGNFLLETSKFPGDVDLYFYIEVQDNDAVSGPKVSTSKKIKLHIIGEFSAHERAIKEIKKFYEKSVHLLAVAIGHLNGKISKEKLVKEIKDMRNEAELVKKKALQTRLSNSLRAFLLKLPERFERLKKMVSYGMKGETVSEAEDIVYKFTEELKLQTIADAYAIAERIRKLVQEAKSALNEGKKDVAEILRKKAEEEINRLRENLSQLPPEIITEFMNPDALQAMKPTGDKEKSLDEYIKDIEDLIKWLENAGRTVAMGGNPEFFNKLQQAKENIGSLIDREIKLKDETERAIPPSRRVSSEDFDELMKKTEKLSNTPDILKGKIRDAKMAFEAGKVRESESYLREVERIGYEMGTFLRDEKFYELARKAHELRKKMKIREGVYEEVPEEYAQKLGDEQRDIRMETKELSSKMGGVVPSLEQAERYMEDAEGSLRGRLMKDAMDFEEKAIDSLKGAEKEVSQRIAEIEEGWKGIAKFLEEEITGGRLSTERVEIPKEEMALNELRKEVLKILRKGLPKRYGEETRRYYEEIIK